MSVNSTTLSLFIIDVYPSKNQSKVIRTAIQIRIQIGQAFILRSTEMFFNLSIVKPHFFCRGGGHSNLSKPVLEGLNLIQ